MTGQDFPNYSSTEGAPSDCSVEAWPGHSEVEEDVDTEGDLRYLVGLQGTRILQLLVAAVAVAVAVVFLRFHRCC